MFRCALVTLIGCAASAPVVPPPDPVRVAADDESCPDAPMYDSLERAPGMVVTADEVIGHAVSAHTTTLRACWLHYWRDHHDSLGGHMVISFHVHTNRAPDGFETRGFSPEVDRCVCDVVSKIDFERLAEATISYPIYFGPP